MHLIDLIRERLVRAQDGFTMAVTMGALMLITTVGLAAYAAADGDIKASADSRERKSAWAAAEAGLNWYVSRLTEDNNYWASCTNVPQVAPGQPAPVNQPWNGTGTDPRRWRQVPGVDEHYTIELLPVPGRSTCTTSNPPADVSMVDPSNGTFRIRATGRYRDEQRSIVAQFRRARFLDFLYFTDYETQDPLAYDSGDVTWANTNCASKYRDERSSSCTDISFPGFDVINGPLHTNDDLLICGSPTFGRAGRNDKVEVSGVRSPGYRATSGCSATPVFRTVFKYAQPTMEMPATNSELLATATAGGLVTVGRTQLTLRADGFIDVRDGAAQTLRTVSWPANGVIYVRNGSCGSTGPPKSKVYTGTGRDPDGCANVEVRGTYARSLTIASAKDIVIMGDIRRSGDALLGLIADQFVRVYHPVNRSSCSSAVDGQLQSVTIDAAILSLQHSFTVDNWDCGPPHGQLTVNGAIAQRYRGVVGQFSGSSLARGYEKNYNYDDRLHYRNPPHFLSPLNSAWRVLRVNEQVPAPGARP
jgi:hypothetical protein